jgi:hypothetical protein
MKSHVYALWNFPAIEQRRRSTRAAVGVRRIIETVMDKMVSKLLVTMLTISDVVCSRHEQKPAKDSSIGSSTFPVDGRIETLAIPLPFPSVPSVRV